MLMCATFLCELRIANCISKLPKNDSSSFFNKRSIFHVLKFGRETSATKLWFNWTPPMRRDIKMSGMFQAGSTRTAYGKALNTKNCR